MSVSTGKPSKARKSKNQSTVGARPAGKIADSEAGELTPIELLLDLMNDERLSHRQRDRIAKKLAPYFHPKLKSIPPVSYDQTDEDAESAARREAVRKNLFGRFD
jgi:hypothetical protein